MGWRSGLAVALAAAAMASGAAAQQGRMAPREAMQLADAAGFTMRGTQALNSCGRATQPRFAFVDLNGDGRPEAIAADIDPGCYGGTGEAFSVLWRGEVGVWNLIGKGKGRLTLMTSRTGPWRDLTLEGGGCQPTWTFRGMQYLPARTCGGPQAAPAPAPVAAAPPAPGGSPADREAAFRAAGFPAVRGKHPACDKGAEATIEIRDLNGDGRPDALVSDYGSECYGSTEQGFVIVTKDAAGTWKKLYASPGIPTFQTTRGAGGWPDIENGGPGFCFPIQRWNGSDYENIRWKAYQPGACAGRR